jgi:hypothetical protein
MPKRILTCIDALDWSLPIFDDLSNEQLVVERNRAYTPIVFQAKKFVYPCRLYTRYVVLADEDARYS